jgi:hypothetical protein
MLTNPKIEHIVVLMMENRSFDHILGFMAQENIEIDGIVGNDYSNLDASGEPHRTTDGAEYQDQLIADPGHDVDDVYFQMFGIPFGTPAAGDPTMSGFAQSYQQQGGDPQDIMRCFRPSRSPIPRLWPKAVRYMQPVVFIGCRPHVAEPWLCAFRHLLWPARYVSGLLFEKC